MGWVISLPNIPVGVLGAVAALLGALVSIKETKGWTRVTLITVFLLCGIGEVLMILRADHIHDSEVSSLQEQLRNIQKQTSANVPHAHAAFLEPSNTKVNGSPHWPFHTGDIPRVVIGIQNVGNAYLNDPYTSSDFMLVPATSVGAGPPSVNIRTDRPDKEWWGMDIPPNTNKIAYITIPGPKLKDEDAKALRNGKSALCAVAKTVWRDDTGCYATELFKCLVAETKDTANWRSGGNDGRESAFPCDSMPISKH